MKSLPHFLVACAFLSLAWLSSLLAQQSDPGADEEGWVGLFDGKTLAGWQANESPGSFKVVDGSIVVHGDRSHLFYTGDVAAHDFRNFELELEVRTHPKANSGVFFHTRLQEAGWPAQGYEAQVNATQDDPRKTGSLYGVVDVTEAMHEDMNWLLYVIRVDGRRITLMIDGATAVDYLEPLDVQGTRRLGSGTFALQAHDPGSRVDYRSIRVRPLPDRPTALTRAERVAFRSEELPWWDRMDYGPFLSATVGVAGSDRVALKGITVELSADRDLSATFDTDLLRMAFGWEGWLLLKNVSFDGSHGGHPTAEGAPYFTTPNRPGWSHDGSFADPRAIPHGPLPWTSGRYRGLYRHGEDVVFSYTVGDVPVLEMPAAETHGGVRAITRTFTVGATEQPLSLTVCDPADDTSVSDRVVTMRRGAPKRVLTPLSGSDDEVVVVTDRAGDSQPWSALAMGGPSATDGADRSTDSKARVSFVKGFAPPHSMAGADGDVLPRTNDGEAADNNDDVQRNTWMDGARARWVMDMGAPIDVARVDTYSWHRTNRSSQRFALWGATAADGEPDATAADPKAAGWHPIAMVDSTELGAGGKHGSAVVNPGGKLGTYRWLLWDMRALEQKEGLFISELDVYAVGQPAPALKEPSTKIESRSCAVALIASDPGLRLGTDATGTVVLELPPGAQERTFKLVFGCGQGSAPDLSGWPAAEDLSSRRQGGPAIWQSTTRVGAELGEGTQPYVVDTIPIPFANPWDCYMRLSGFDFFASGKKAAVCTWNGDVWLVDGLGGDLKQITWTRFAAGLFETLGLRIVDDVIYVHGRDQITKLHDLNGDGEADFYECFNNEFQVTENFHEFSFDLQTDSAGNFYVGKAGPVRPGGRGFDKIVPQHGTVMKIAKDGGKLDVYATGMRAPNGIAVSPTGQVTASDNEGSWVPHCKLHWLQPGSFQGVVPLAHGEIAPTTYNPPLCWFPMEVDNSGGGQVWVTGERWGPFTGDLLHLSYGQSSIYKVMIDSTGAVAQGGVVRLPVTLGSSAMRARFNPADGQLYVAGLRGWQTNAATLAGFQRVRYTGKPVLMPKELRVLPGGLALTFTCELSRELAEDPASYDIEQWNYVWGPMYGSPEVSASNPDAELIELAKKTEQQSVKVHDKLKVASAELSEDGRTVILEIPDLIPVMQMHIRTDLETPDGQELLFHIYNTVNQVPAAK